MGVGRQAPVALFRGALAELVELRDHSVLTRLLLAAGGRVAVCLIVEVVKAPIAAAREIGQ
jgi:hypothetical protein